MAALVWCTKQRLSNFPAVLPSVFYLFIFKPNYIHSPMNSFLSSLTVAPLSLVWFCWTSQTSSLLRQFPKITHRGDLAWCNGFRNRAASVEHPPGYYNSPAHVCLVNMCQLAKLAIPLIEVESLNYPGKMPKFVSCLYPSALWQESPKHAWRYPNMRTHTQDTTALWHMVVGLDNAKKKLQLRLQLNLHDLLNRFILL